MSDITVEQLVENLEDALKSLSEEKTVNWDQVEQTENDLMRNFDAVFQRLIVLKEGLQRVFLMNLKTLRQVDARELLLRVKDKKLENSVLKTLLPFASKNSEGKIVLNEAQIKEQVNSTVTTWQANNQVIIDRLKETTSFVDQQFEKLDVFKAPPTVNKEENKQQEESKGQIAVKQFSFQSEKLNDIASQIQVHHIPNTKDMISIKTYTQVVEGSVDLAESEFIRVTQKNRQERRGILYSDAQKYVQLLMDYVNDIENLLMKAQEEICSKVNISQQTLEQSEILLMERGLGQHIFMLQASARQRIKDKLPKQKQVQMSSTKDIIKYQIKLLNEKQDFLKNIVDKLPNSYEAGQLVPMVLNLVMGDMIFEEYSYEEEDYIANLENPDLFKDPEVMELLKGIEQGVVNLLGKTAFAQPMMQGMGGMNPMQMGMPNLPGMMPPQ